VDLATADAEGDVIDGRDASEPLDHVVEPDDFVRRGWASRHARVFLHCASSTIIAANDNVMEGVEDVEDVEGYET
jgi:hypothetical protein